MEDQQTTEKDVLDDDRPIDLEAIIELLEAEIDNGGETGIWGDYGAAAAPLNFVVRLLRENADAIENRVGEYAEGGDSL